jgi:hypothetical protein
MIMVKSRAYSRSSVGVGTVVGSWEETRLAAIERTKAVWAFFLVDIFSRIQTDTPWRFWMIPSKWVLCSLVS